MIGFTELLASSRGIRSLRDGIVGGKCSVKVWNYGVSVSVGPPGKCCYTWGGNTGGQKTKKISEIFLAGGEGWRGGSSVQCYL